MYLAGSFFAPIETALARMAPGERVAWHLNMTELPLRDHPGTGRVFELVLVTPSPKAGDALSWAWRFTNPFTLLDQPAELDRVIAEGLTALRQLASELIRDG